jgi:hypothetical protein
MKDADMKIVMNDHEIELIKEGKVIDLNDRDEKVCRRNKAEYRKEKRDKPHDRRDDRRRNEKHDPGSSDDRGFRDRENWSIS